MQRRTASNRVIHIALRRLSLHISIFILFASALHARAATNFIGGVINFGSGQTYAGPVVLTNDTTIHAAGFITFGSTVDGPYNLTISAGGNTSFDAAVGADTSLSSLVVGTNTAIYINNAPIITTGKQSYNGNLNVSGAVSLTSTAGGSMMFGGILGNGPSDLIVNSAGTTTLNGNSFGLSSLTVGGGGAFIVNGSELYTVSGGSETFNESVLLTQDTTVNCSNITFASTVDGAVALSVFHLGKRELFRCRRGCRTFDKPPGVQWRERNYAWHLNNDLRRPGL